MIRLHIDNKEILTEAGATIMTAAKRAGIDIPSMCYNEDAGAFASCMVCVVKDGATGKLIPSCAALAEEGMQIITMSDEIREARKMALELLLSDHTGDCEAPCRVTCPAHMNIPLMNRLLAAGKTTESLKIVLENIPIPSVLGYICPAPCEGACRRKTIDQAVSICLLKRYSGEAGLFPGYADHSLPPEEQRRIAIIGAGPAGLSAGYYLQQMGYSCVLFDRNEAPGGMLRYGVPENDLPRPVLDREVNYIIGSGIEFSGNINVNREMFESIASEYDAVVIATGEIDNNIAGWNLEMSQKGIHAHKDSYQTSVKHIFAIGNVLRPSKMAVRSVGQGREAAISIRQYFSGEKVTGPPALFNSRFGKLNDAEIIEYLKESIKDNRMLPAGGIPAGYTAGEVTIEAARCLHCDCRDLDTCQLRKLSGLYQSNQKRFWPEQRKSVSKKWVHDSVIYEPAKCIKCGICVRLTEKYKFKYGFTYIGRGFDVKIGIPFDEDLRSSLAETAEKVAAACPTGALSIDRSNIHISRDS
jgi:NADPH-dependent glutamate synthase beta subunit-like oxidoreductase/ferredoxin